MFSSAQGAAALSLLTNIALVALKVGVGLSIGSISVLSDAMDSASDLVGAFIALAAVRFSARPADREHPYGHGKMENVSGVMESLLILLAAGLVTGEAARRLASPSAVGSVGLGIAAMSVSLALNGVVSWHLRRVAHRTGSIALAATATHRTSDILTSLGVLVGLIILQLSPSKAVDPAIAIAVASYVAWTAVRLFGRAYRDLLDVRLPDVEEALVREALVRHAARYVEYHDLRTRRSGRQRYVELHLLVPRLMTVAEAHELTDVIEADMERVLPGAVITIHVEPCEVSQAACDAQCTTEAVPLCQREPHASEAHEHVGS